MCRCCGGGGGGSGCCKETTCSAAIQPAALISGCVTRRSWGAPWSPRPLSVRGLSCRGPGCSERCRSLRRRPRPHSRRKTLQTVWASHKHSSLEDRTHTHTHRVKMWIQVMSSLPHRKRLAPLFGKLKIQNNILFKCAQPEIAATGSECER